VSKKIKPGFHGQRSPDTALACSGPIWHPIRAYLATLQALSRLADY